ncbi:hypothetical protein [Arthrobacter pigmenti]
MSVAGWKDASTGLWISTGFTAGYRVAKSTYGGLNPPPRKAGSDRQSWGRYDTEGSTVYLAADAVTAFGEVIAPFALILRGNSPLQKDADFLGMPLAEFIQQFKSHWEGSSYMNTGCLPTQWHRPAPVNGRVPAPQSWVEIEHPSSLAAIRGAVGEDLAAAAAIEGVTLAEIHAPDRDVTTRVAEWVRAQTLANGQHPAGMAYTSKLGGRCYAYWLRHRDDGGDSEPMRITSTRSIRPMDPSLKAACEQLNIHCF